MRLPRSVERSNIYMLSTRDIAAKLVDSFMDPKLKITDSINCGRVTLSFAGNGSVLYSLDGRPVHIFNSEAKTADGRLITTKEAKRSKPVIRQNGEETEITAEYKSESLTLTQQFSARKTDAYFTVKVILRDEKALTRTNNITPLAFIYPSSQCDPMFRSLSQKMLVVPYDNDMWVRYENVPLSPGRTSYDVTAISCGMRGLVTGSIKHDIWKSAIKCSAYDARVYSAFCGVADEGTHDSIPHGIICGDEVESAPFFCGMYEDIRDGLEEYGDCVKKENGMLEWTGGVPFGWNSYSALMAALTTNHWSETARFLKNEVPCFSDENGVQYINLDAHFGLSRKKKAKIIEECHKRNQKVGTYIAPLMVIPVTAKMPLKGSKKRKCDILLKKSDGSDYPAIDGSLPVDITVPEAETGLRLTLREIVSDGYDYLKIDFLSHGALEGKRFDENIKTGRQALMRFYEILHDELSREKTGRDIFISLSIAPLFPSGHGHVRRCCCDAFGHIEDSDYVLSSLRHGWWESGRLYAYADPDHTVLCNSVVDKRGLTSEKEAELRYNTSLISGTVMLLSDNYGPYGDKSVITLSKERAKLIANNSTLNEVARLGKAFRPLYIGENCNIFYLNNGIEKYLALFNFGSEKKQFTVSPSEIGFKSKGILIDLSDCSETEYENKISITLDGYASVIIKAE